MPRHCNEQAYHVISQQTKEHRRLHHTYSSRRKLMSMPGKVKRFIWRLNIIIIMPTYSQVTTWQRLRCMWCDEDYNSITKHWLRHCPAMGYWQELMTTRLTEREAHLDDRKTTITIFNSQNEIAYEEITGLLRNCPLPEPNSLDDRYIRISIFNYNNSSG